MMAFVATLKIRPEQRETFEKASIELRQLTYKHEPNTPFYEMLQSRDDKDTYLIVATFKDQAAFDFHMKTDFHERLVPPILAALAQEMDLKFYDVKL